MADPTRKESISTMNNGIYPHVGDNTLRGTRVRPSATFQRVFGSRPPDDRDEADEASDLDGAEEAPQLVRVMLTRRMAGKSFWERDPRHPGGEIWLTEGQVAEVALTERVWEALNREPFILRRTRKPLSTPAPNMIDLVDEQIKAQSAAFEAAQATPPGERPLNFIGLLTGAGWG